MIERPIFNDLVFRRNSSLTDLTVATRLDHRCVVVNNGVQISADGRLRCLPAEPSTAITAVKIKYEAGASGGFLAGN